jgi:hypothetical protein
MNALFGTALAGLATFLLSIPSYLRAKTDEHSPFWRPRGKSAAHKLARRVSIAMSRRGILLAWILFVPSLLMLMALVALSIGSGSLSFPMRLGMIGSYLGGVVLGVGLGYLFGLGRSIRQGLLAVATQAGKAIARRGSTIDAERLLARAATRRQQHLRLAAAISLRYLGTSAGNATLEQLSQDPDPAVRNAAISSLHNIQAVLNGTERKSVIGLAEIAERFLQVEESLDFLVDGSNRSSILVEYHHLREIFEGVVYAQLPLRRVSPHLFCLDCLCRAEIQVFQDWSWVRCKRCLDVHGLKPNVVTVIGQIGGVSDWELHRDELRLSLWDVEDRKARGAEIDALEIVGQQEISYDWAVSAVVEQLRAYARDGECTVPIRFIHAPKIAPNTLNLLRLVDRSVIVA